MNLSDITSQTREVATLFDILVGKWEPAVMATELTAEVGTLADSIMIHEGHKRGRGETIDLEDDIADVLFMLIRIADHYHINIGEAYSRMIDTCREKLT